MGEIDCGDLSDDAQRNASDRYERARTWDTLAWVSLGVGAAAVVGSVLWYALSPRGERAQRSAMRFGGSFQATGAVATATVTF
jgi:hypothetical protein